MTHGIRIRTTAAFGAALALACSSTVVSAQIPLITPAVNAAGVVVDTVAGVVRGRSHDPLNSAATRRANHFKHHTQKNVHFLSSNSTKY